VPIAAEPATITGAVRGRRSRAARGFNDVHVTDGDVRRHRAGWHDSQLTVSVADARRRSARLSPPANGAWTDTRAAETSDSLDREHLRGPASRRPSRRFADSASLPVRRHHGVAQHQPRAVRPFALPTLRLTIAWAGVSRGFLYEGFNKTDEHESSGDSTGYGAYIAAHVAAHLNERWRSRPVLGRTNAPLFRFSGRRFFAIRLAARRRPARKRPMGAMRRQGVSTNTPGVEYWGKPSRVGTR